MEVHTFEEVPVEVMDTSYMCGECFLLFRSTEEFNAHHCLVEVVEDKVHNGATEAVAGTQPTTSTLDASQPTHCVQIETWEAVESEAAMEEAVASILGARMKCTGPQEHPAHGSQLKPVIEKSESLSDVKDLPQDPLLLDHTAESTHHPGGNTQPESVEIPTTNLYMFDNPVYLNRLMKDNTFGRRMRHDAPYSQRLGPWDNKSSRLLIKLLIQYPRAYFILDKKCKRTEAWELIRIKLAEAGYQFTVLQIRMRWRELCKKYRNTVNHNDMYRTRKTCQFFDELNDLFGVWDHPATLLLIRQLEANGGKPLGQNGGTRMRIKVWEHIRQVLASHGYKYTADQVQGRWSNLVTLYQRMVEHNSRPHNESITIAFKDHIERIFNYVPERNSKWLKIMEKRGKTPRVLTKKWTVAVERKLLILYYGRVYRFNNDHIDNSTLWKEIVEKLEEEEGYSTTVEKARTRFYDLTKQFSLTEQHNAQPGTIRRECKHHEMLAEIYNVYNFWPHDRSKIKMEKTSTIRMRQVNAQLMWSEEQSRSLLRLYPSVLVSHISSGDHQPMEELWLQLAKAYMSAAHDRKQCYEIEEHIALLRRGYHSQNPFPFMAEMQFLEETESTLGFVPSNLSIPANQLVSYWSHRAAHLLLDFVIHHRQEGVKNPSLFEAVSLNLAEFGYKYTGEECRVYYSLLRQLYTNRLRTIRRNRELIKPFPYMDKMAEVDAVVSQPKFVETPESRQAVLSAADSTLSELKGDDTEVKKDHILVWLVNLKMILKQNESILPPPSVKCLARILADAVEDSSSGGAEVDRCRGALAYHLNHLKLIAGKGISSVESTPVNKSKGKKTRSASSVPQPKYGSVQWKEKNLYTMLRVIREWRLQCHDSAEVELMLGRGQPLWREVASNITCKIDPNKCYERFAQFCREYKSVMAFNAQLAQDQAPKSLMCQEAMDNIMSLNVFHDAQLDLRDRWWASDKSGVWRQDETLDLIFTVREVWTAGLRTNWDVVSELMASSGYKHSAESCQEKFQYLYKSYQSALQHNQHCSMRTRRRPPFYYKLNDLFGIADVNAAIVIEPTPDPDLCPAKAKVWAVLVTFLRDIKRHHCHSVPRRPLLLLLAQHLKKIFYHERPAFNSCSVWRLMVELHQVHYDAALHNTELQDDINLRDLWQKDTKPVVAYGLHALPTPGWEKACHWSPDEVQLLLEAVVSWVVQRSSQEPQDRCVEVAACEWLSAHGYDRSAEQCLAQWHYIMTTYPRGGYRQFSDQINLIHVLAPSLSSPHTSNVNHCGVAARSHQQQQQEATEGQTVTIPSFPGNREDTTTHVSKKRKTESHQSTNVTSKGGGGGGKGSASGNVTSYVQINVPNNSTVTKCHAQMSTSEHKKAVKSVSRSTEKSLDVSADKNRNSKRSPCISGQKSSRGKGGLKKVNSLHTDHKSQDAELSPEKADNTKASKDKVRVEVLSISENENVKLIECQTMPGINPTRTFRLHFPANHPLPPGVQHLYLPQAMVHPDSVPPSGTQPPSKPSDAPVKNASRAMPSSPPGVLEAPDLKQSQCKGGEQSEGESELPESECSAAVSGGTDVSPEKGLVLDLLAQYCQHCQRGRQRLHSVIQENHQHHISALKKILSVFKQLQECV